MWTSLVVILFSLISNNVEELESVLSLGSADHTKPIAQHLLLQEFLSEVLEVAARELLVGDNLDASIAKVADCDVVAKVAGTAIDLDALLEEGGEGASIEDTIINRLLGVDDVLEWIMSVMRPSRQQHTSRSIPSW